MFTLTLTTTTGQTETHNFDTRSEAEAFVTTLNSSLYTGGRISENTGHACPGIRYCDECQAADAAAEDEGRN